MKVCSEFKMGAIDCTENVLVCGRFDIKSFPSARFFEDAESDGQDFKLTHSASGIGKGLRRKMSKGKAATPFENTKSEGWGEGEAKDVVHLTDEHWMSWRKENPKVFVMF